VTIVLAVAAMSGVSSGSATDCTSGKSLRELGHEATVIWFGTVIKAKGVGYELADGTISKTGPVLGVTYVGNVERLDLRVRQIFKGDAGQKLEAYLSLPILNPSDCPDRPLLIGQAAVVVLSQRSTGYWVVGGRDGIIFTGDSGVPGIVMQFTEPTKVK